MKTRIIIFSQTDNTQRVAEEIRAGILLENHGCDLGKFRWHIDSDDIDYENPLYRQRRHAAGN